MGVKLLRMGENCESLGCVYTTTIVSKTYVFLRLASGIKYLCLHGSYNHTQNHIWILPQKNKMADDEGLVGSVFCYDLNIYIDTTPVMLDPYDVHNVFQEVTCKELF